MSLVGQAYDEPGSWGRLSEGWVEFKARTEAEYDEAWAFCVAHPPRKKVVPYGSYVGMCDYRSYYRIPGNWERKYGKKFANKERANLIIRLEDKKYLKALREHMKGWREKRRDTSRAV